MSNSQQKGQAALELAALLVGLAAVLLGIIFVCGVALTDNGILLEAKYHAEAASHAAGTPLDGGEYRTWTRAEVDPFNRRENVVIPFTARDRAARSEDNAISGAGDKLSSSGFSEPQTVSGGGYSATYDYRWLSPHDFNSGSFTADFQSGVSGSDNAFSAAALVAGRGSDQGGNSLLNTRDQAGPHSSGNARRRMENALFTWFGLHVSQIELENSPANVVYMPINHPAE